MCYKVLSMFKSRDMIYFNMNYYRGSWKDRQFFSQYLLLKLSYNFLQEVKVLVFKTSVQMKKNNIVARNVYQLNCNDINL